MVRAATEGAVDFSTFDPNNKYCWRKLQFVLKELHSKDLKKTAELQHDHWTTLLSVDALEEEQWEEARVNAYNSMSTLMTLYFPWLEDHLETTATTGAAGLEAEFRELYGYPGEERYEQMLKESAEAWRKINQQWRQDGKLQEGDD
jgi:hypothetical protein